MVGQGVIGLTSAIRLAEAGFRVTVFARNDFDRSTSMSAGAYWWPHKLYPEHRVRRWAPDSLQVYRQLSQSPDSGVRLETHRRYCVDVDDCGYARDLLDSWSPISGSTLGLDCVDAYEVTVPVIDVPIFLPYLRSCAQQLGIAFIRRELTHPLELAPDFRLIVNCTGIGARSFSNDELVVPIRGQVLRMSAPNRRDRTSIRVFRKEQHFTLVLPRTNDLILGGTSTSGDWNLTASDEDTAAILRNCSEVAPYINRCNLLETHVGLRPGRPEVRLEIEQVSEQLHVIHNYGHGGGGFTVAWGCADEAAGLVRSTLAVIHGSPAGPISDRAN